MSVRVRVYPPKTRLSVSEDVENNYVFPSSFGTFLLPCLVIKEEEKYIEKFIDKLCQCKNVPKLIK